MPTISGGSGDTLDGYRSLSALQVAQMDLAAMTVLFSPQQFKRSSDAFYDPEGLLDLLLETLDLVDLAIMLVDRTARVLYANRAALTHLGDGTVIRVCCGRLAPLGAKSSAGLRAALASFSSNTKRRRPPHGAVVPLADADGVIRAASWMLPLAAKRLSGFDPHGVGCVALFLREIGCHSAISDEFFACSYGVTQAELRLLDRLAEGKTVSEAGEVLSVSLNTVRSHLKSLFAKTGTGRQAELMRLVLNSTPPASMLDDARPLAQPVRALAQSVRTQPPQHAAST
jgi:DNA-binding CsgD family transcriptional regulator